MAAVVARAPKPKSTMSAVRGKIVVFAEDGERIGQWGGTECFLSRQTGLGPCLVVRSSRHKRHEATFFLLARLERVVSTHVAQGRLTVMVGHAKRRCSVFIDTTEDLDELRMMAGLLQEKRRWVDVERNVLGKASAGVRRADMNSGADSRAEVEWGNVRASPLTVGGTEREEASDDDSMLSDSPASVTGRQLLATSQDSSAEPRSPRFPSHPVVASTTPTARQVHPDAAANAAAPASPHSPVHRGSGVASNDKEASVSVPPAPTVAPSWNSDMRRAWQLVRAGRNTFISGAAGTGKTEWLLHVLHHELPRIGPRRRTAPGTEGRLMQGDPRDLRPRVAVTAATGIAARLLGGTTVHAFAGIGRGEGDVEVLLQRVQRKPDVVRAWQECEILIIDEISMLSGYTFALLDRVARALRAPRTGGDAEGFRQSNSNAALPFGGIQLVVVGDFLQLPPVSRSGERGSEGEEVKPVFTTAAWRASNFETVVFKVDHRHADDPRFAECCASVRRGECTPLVRDVLKSCLGRQLEERFGVEATTLLARRRDVDQFNAQRLQLLESPQFHRYTSEDYAALPGADIDSEVSLPSVLTLKEGAQVVLLASLPHESSLANGDVGVVTGFVTQLHGSALPQVRFASGLEVVVPAITMEVYGRDGRLSLSRRQVPLQLAWALTVHRVQGMTLPMVRMAFDKTLFEAGQAYVAVSRVRRAEDLSLTALDTDVVAARVSAEAREFYDGLDTTLRRKSEPSPLSHSSPMKTVRLLHSSHRETAYGNEDSGAEPRRNLDEVEAELKRSRTERWAGGLMGEAEEKRDEGGSHGHDQVAALS